MYMCMLNKRVGSVGQRVGAALHIGKRVERVGQLVGAAVHVEPRV